MMFKELERDPLQQPSEDVEGGNSVIPERAEAPLESPEEASEIPPELLQEAEAVEQSPVEIAKEVAELEAQIPEAPLEDASQAGAVAEQEPVTDDAREDSFARKAGRGVLKAIRAGAKAVTWVPLRVSAKVFNKVFRSDKVHSWYWKSYKGDKVADNWITAITGEGSYTEKTEDDE